MKNNKYHKIFTPNLSTSRLGWLYFKVLETAPKEDEKDVMDAFMHADRIASKRETEMVSRGYCF